LDGRDRAASTEDRSARVDEVWAREWAKEGVTIDWEKLLPPKGFRFCRGDGWWNAPFLGWARTAG
jgi:hypothetical protein